MDRWKRLFVVMVGIVLFGLVGFVAYLDFDLFADLAFMVGLGFVMVTVVALIVIAAWEYLNPPKSENTEPKKKQRSRKIVMSDGEILDPDELSEDELKAALVRLAAEAGGSVLGPENEEASDLFEPDSKETLNRHMSAGHPDKVWNDVLF